MDSTAEPPQVMKMAQIQIKNVDPKLVQALKISAAQAGMNYGQFVLSVLRTATLPPVVVAGTDQKASQRKR